MSASPIKFAVLVTAGSPGPRRVLAHLRAHGFVPHTAYLLSPDWRANLRRVRRKLFSAGVAVTIARIFQVLGKLGAPRTSETAKQVHIDPFAEVRTVAVRAFEESMLLEDARAQNFDVFLAMTDELLKRRTFSLPRFGTLNAHPARNPEYRGLSALERMIRDGQRPEITLHLVDEGIDTGPIIRRLVVDEEVVRNGTIDEVVVSRWQANAFIAGLKLLSAQGRWTFEDRFTAPSNMSPPLSAADIRTAIARHEQARHDGAKA